MATAAEIEALRQELAALEAEETSLLASIGPASATVDTAQPTDYSLGQFAFDVPVGVAKAGAGLGDLLSMALDPFAASRGVTEKVTGVPQQRQTLTGLVEQGAEAVAPILGVRPKTEMQRAVEFVTPLPGPGKARLAADALMGLASYGGTRAAEAIAPESQYAGLVGGLLPSALSITRAAVSPRLKETGEAMQRSARGVTKADYTNVSKSAVIENIEGDFETQLKASLNRINERNVLGKSLDPEITYSNLQTEKTNIENEIQTVLTKVEKEQKQIPIPQFNKTLDYISKRIAADEVDRYLNRLDEYRDALKQEGKGSLTYLNTQKKIVGENWKNSPESDPGFWKALYGDMKTHIEKYAPEIKTLNEQKRDLLVVEPIVERNKRQAEKGLTIDDLRRGLLYTTGGLGLPGAAYMFGGVPGGILAGSLALAATPKGQQLIGKALSKDKSLGQSLANAIFTGTKAVPDEMPTE